MSKEILGNTAGEVWLKAMRLVSQSSEQVRDGSELLKEVLNLVIEVQDAQAMDDIVQRFSDKEMLTWMRANFVE